MVDPDAGNHIFFAQSVPQPLGQGYPPEKHLRTLRCSVRAHHESDVLERNKKDSHYHNLIIFRSTNSIVASLQFFTMGSLRAF